MTYTEFELKAAFEFGRLKGMVAAFKNVSKYAGETDKEILLKSIKGVEESVNTGCPPNQPLCKLLLEFEEQCKDFDEKI